MARQRSRSEQANQGAFPLADLHERPPPPVPWLRILLGGLLGLAILAAAAAGLIRALIDTEQLHADALAALRAATGRQVRIEGPLTIVSYFGATVAIDDVVIPNLANPSRDLARIARIEAELSLYALLLGRTEIQRVVVSGPELALEIAADGSGNWQNPPPAATTPTPDAPPAPLLAVPPAIHIRDGRLTFTDARSGGTTTIALRRIALAEPDAGGLLALVADLAVGTQRINVNGQVGPLARLADRTATTPWPLRLTLDTQDAKLTVAGGIEHPLALSGYALKIDAWVADTSTLSEIIPYRLPVMRTVSLTARISDHLSAAPTIPDRLRITPQTPARAATAASPSLLTLATDFPGFPDIAGARLQMGASDFSAWVPGLKLDTVEITVPALEQSARAEMLGTLNGVPVRLLANLGGLAALLPDRAAAVGAFPVDVALEMGDTKLTLKGSIAALAQRRGLDLALDARVRDLALLSPLAGRRLPALRNTTLTARLDDGDASGFADSLGLRAISLVTPHGDLSGDLVLGHTPRWSLRGSLKGAKLDADALGEALGPSLGPIDIIEHRSPFRPPAWDDTRIIPTAKLRLDLLRRADADLTLSLDELRAVGVTYRKLLAPLRLDHGRMTLGPVIADLPAGQASVRLDIDAADPRTPMHLRAAIPGVPIQPLLAGSTRRDNLFGALEVHADLTAEGDSPRALAATATGRLGLAIVEGDIDSRVLLDPLAGIMGAARVPLNLATQMGTLARLRCFAARFDAEQGQTRIGTLLLESGRVLIDGEGSFNLATEQLAMRLRSAIRIPGQAVSVPSRIEGSFAAPTMALETPDPARGAAIARPDAPDYCLPALELARAGRPGPAPAARDARPFLVVPNRPTQR
ncbi:MAG: AsmA family protein [Acetobacteraceae bacterium]|nr:AsmA family protein [Acetobacteraceae bacterium]